MQYTLPFNLSGLIALLVLTAMGCGMQNLCRRRNSEEDEETSSLGYSVAVSNSMFREERWVQAEIESDPTFSLNLGFSHNYFSQNACIYFFY